MPTLYCAWPQCVLGPKHRQNPIQRSETHGFVVIGDLAVARQRQPDVADDHVDRGRVERSQQFWTDAKEILTAWRDLSAKTEMADGE